MPIILVCLSDGSIALAPRQQFATIISLANEKCREAIFDMSGFKIGDEEFMWSTRYYYKEIPVLLEWLKGQELVSPV